MDEAGIVALVTRLADRSNRAPHPQHCFTLWLREVPEEELGAVEDWAFAHGGHFVRKEVSVTSTPLAGRSPLPASAKRAHWVLPLSTLRS